MAQVAHPWHGIGPRTADADIVNVFVEIVPDAAMKFELDKASGWLRLDRPQKFTSRPPAMYGFIPQTLCGDEVARRCAEMLERTEIVGDGDPMDILVLSHEAPAHGGFIVQAHAIGGLRLIDHQEADDKIIAVLESDPVFGHLRDIAELPAVVTDQLLHYFVTYKQPPGEQTHRVQVEQVYDRNEAEYMIALSLADYSHRYLKPSSRRKP